MKALLSLDAHAHLDPARPPIELANSGAVLAMTFALEDAACAVERRDAKIAWGVGCHPRNVRALETFDARQFENLVKQTAIVGEVGLDTGSRAPLKIQLHVFRQILEVVAELPRLVRIHSVRATGLVIDELQRRPLTVPVLHGWTGTVAETRAAVALGCYFSIHSQVARYSRFRTAVPLARVLVETDHGINDPPAAIPCRIEWVEHLVAQQYSMDVKEVRRLAWKNFRTIIGQTNTHTLLPRALAAMIAKNRSG